LSRRVLGFRPGRDARLLGVGLLAPLVALARGPHRCFLPVQRMYGLTVAARRCLTAAGLVVPPRITSV
jgi:hypothetical protein